MSASEFGAELRKLARLLGVTPERIDYLASVPPQRLAAIRIAMGQELLARNAEGLTRIAGTAKVLPTAVVAKVTERNGHALLTARLAAMMDSGRAADIARRLSDRYLAQVATHLDGPQAQQVIAQLPDKVLDAVRKQLTATQDWLTLGAIVSWLGTDSAANLLRAMGSDAPAVLDAVDAVDRERVRATLSSTR
ncbi:hypothetical protein ACFVUS_28030 [Nocardia sp. NPDC058058]|uniref:hypothetical protein n=1 Tax=Nocardia sp. NPDC058058 TaxID=3346317 RepID=UPI0036DF4961